MKKALTMIALMMGLTIAAMAQDVTMTKQTMTVDRYIGTQFDYFLARDWFSHSYFPLSTGVSFRYGYVFNNRFSLGLSLGANEWNNYYEDYEYPGNSNTYAKIGIVVRNTMISLPLLINASYSFSDWAVKPTLELNFGYVINVLTTQYSMGTVETYSGGTYGTDYGWSYIDENNHKVTRRETAEAYETGYNGLCAGLGLGVKQNGVGLFFQGAIFARKTDYTRLIKECYLNAAPAEATNYDVRKRMDGVFSIKITYDFPQKMR